MAQPAGYKNPLGIPAFWQEETAELPMELTKRIAKIEMAILAKDGIEVRTLRHVKPRAIEPTEPIYELEITGKTEAEKRKQDIQKPGD